MITKRISFSLIGLVGLLLPAGCAHLYDPIDESLSCLHCEVEAAETWLYVRGQYAHVNYPHHFGAGFRAGYVNVCRGRGECPPTLPPKSYWTVWYRNPTGREKAVEWFNGFTAGAATAMQNGHAAAGELVTAPGVTGSCDCFANAVEFELPGVHSPPAEPTRHLSTPPPAESPWQLRETKPALPVPPEFAEEFPSAPRVPGPPLTNSPEPPRASGAGADTKPTFQSPPQPTSDATVDEDSTASPLPLDSTSLEPLRFGHSIGPASPRQNPNASAEPLISDEPRPGQLPHDSPKESVGSTPGNPDAAESLEDSAPVPDYRAPPANEPPPLEDRFLPRGGPDAAQEFNSSRRSRRPRSLLEAIGRVEHTSHSVR